MGARRGTRPVYVPVCRQCRPMLAELLGAVHLTEGLGTVQHQVEGLAIEWIALPATSPAVGTTIGDGMYRTKTGATVVAVMRRGASVPAPGPTTR